MRMPPLSKSRTFSFRIERAVSPKAKGKGRQIDATVDLDYVFRGLFGQSEYRGAQREIMQAALQNLDILVLAPTGYGKSLCFQVPALTLPHGITLVVSPLLALMRDQVSALRKLGIAAAALTSSSTLQDRNRILRDLRAGHPKLRLLYISPERLTDRNFLSALRLAYRQHEIVRLVIDEAHVIPSWGDSFRPEYGRLGRFREVFPRVPIMALTASATESTADEIMKSLRMSPRSTWRVSHGVDRPNLFYEVRYDRDDRIARCEAVANFLQELPCSNGKRSAGIIYCRSRNSVEELSNYLRGRGFLAAPYHKGLDKEQLNITADLWQYSQEHFEQEKPYIDCLVATIAFGMGVDKSDVRYIVHWDLPTSFEGYYQETGRAGRDGQDSRCLLFYSREDGQRAHGLVLKSLEQKTQKEMDEGQASLSSVSELIRLCETPTSCRHERIAAFFGDELDGMDSKGRCQDKMCDICRSPKRTQQLFDKDLSDPEAVPPPVLTERETPRNDRQKLKEATAAPRQPPSAPRSIATSAKSPYFTGEFGPSRPPKRPFATEQSVDIDEPDWRPPRITSKAPAKVDIPVPKGFKAPSRTTRLPGAPKIPAPALRSPPRPLTPTTAVTEGDARPQKKKRRKPDAPRRQEGDDISHDFLLFGLSVEVQPQTYAKPIPLSLREEGVTAVAKHLGRACLADEGMRSRDEQAVIFRYFGLQALGERERVDFVIAISLALESEVFWTSSTSDGFIDNLSRRKKAAKALSASRDWFMRGATPTDAGQAHILDVMRRHATKIGAKRAS